MRKTPPILMFCDDKNDMTSSEIFAEHFPDLFLKKDKIKEMRIHRCYIIFHDNPADNKFLKTLEIVYKFHAASCWTNVYLYENCLIAVAQEGGPAAASLMEELSVFGIEEFVALGSAGCLDEKYKQKLVLVTKAIRDEGTSYHYLKPSIFCETSKSLNVELKEKLSCLGLDFVEGISWTNDAFYRETQSKLNYALELGAIAVEMECASWCACAKFRHFKFTQILFFSDVVKQTEWQRITKNVTELSNKRDVIVEIVKKIIEIDNKK